MNIYEQKIITGQVSWTITPLSIKDSLEFDGLCDTPMEAEINISKEISGERAIDVLLHESIHAMEHMYGYEIPEETVGKLGNMLGRLFIENEWMTTYINEQIQIHKIRTTNEGTIIQPLE